MRQLFVMRLFSKCQCKEGGNFGAQRSDKGLMVHGRPLSSIIMDNGHTRSQRSQQPNIVPVLYVLYSTDEFFVFVVQRINHVTTHRCVDDDLLEYC